MIIHGPTSSMKAMKLCCVGCGQAGVEMSKEHFWPQWLIRKTGTTSVRFSKAKKIHPAGFTFPLCIRCNHDFGLQLESPVARIFDQLEMENGLSDDDSELLVRWLWKFEGLAWLSVHPVNLYSSAYTLRERVLNPINQIRAQLSLAVALIREIDPIYGDAPLGIDSENELNAIFVSGVFSKIALMVLLRQFETLVPKEFSIYRLADQRLTTGKDARLFYPKVGFRDDTEAVGVTKIASLELSRVHERIARELQQNVPGLAL